MQIIFEESGINRYAEALVIINDMEKQNKDIGNNMRKSFLNCWDSLTRILTNSYPDGILYIGSDFVPGSFSFLFKHDAGKMNGGMILHGFGETFSVELSGDSNPHWSIHT